MRGMRRFFIGSAVFLCVAAIVSPETVSTAFRELVRGESFIPRTCWDSRILVVNNSRRFVDHMVIREGTDIFWQGRVGSHMGGCVPVRSGNTVATFVEATFEDGTQVRQTITPGIVIPSVDYIHLLLIEPTEIRHIPYMGTQNTPISSAVDPLFSTTRIAGL